MNRKQRRAAARKAKKAPAGLARAGQQVATAMEALQKIEGLEGTAKMLEGLQGEIQQSMALVQAMVSDLEAMSVEVGQQREVMLRLLARILASEQVDEGTMLQNLRAIEETVRAEMQMGAESTDEGS